MIRRNEYLTDTRKKTARLVIGMAAVFLLFFLMLPAVACAEEAGTLAKIEGNVDILRAGETKAVPAMLNDTISIGDVIRTKSGGKVEIHFIDNTVLRLASGSRLKIDKYVFNPDKTRQSAAVTLFRGQLRAIVTKASGAVPASTASTATFNINTPTAVAGVLGTDLFVYYENGVTGVLFKDGHGMVFNANNPAGAVPVAAGYVTFITGADADPLEPRPATDLELDQHIKATNPDGGTSGGGETPDTPVVELFIDDSGAGGAAGDTFAPPPVDLISADIIPVVTIYGAPPSATNQSTLNLSLVFSKAVTATYILNGVGIITPTGLWTDTLNVAGLAEGPQSLSIQVKDAGGNTSQLYVINWTTDYTPPVTAILTAPPALTNTSNFGFTANEPIAYYSYSMDGGTTWVSSGSTLSLSAVDAPEGGNTIQVKSTDVAGNTSVGFDTYSWTTDYTPPVLTFDATPTAVNALNAAAFLFSSNEAGGTLSYSLDNGLTWTASTGTETFTAPANFDEGLQTLSIMAVDAAGNPSTVASTYTWFYGARQYDMTGAAIDAADPAVLSASATGNLNLISTGTQGGWTLNAAGTYVGAPSTNVVAGGTATDSLAALDGYWIDKMDLATGTSDFTYLSKTVYGSGVGTVVGGYDGLGGFSATDTGLGTYTETPLTHVSEIYANDYYIGDPYLYGYSYSVNDGSFSGYFGGTDSLWVSASTPVSFMGAYYPTSSASHIWGTEFNSYNYTNSTDTTYNNGAYHGYITGTEAGGALETLLYALYVDDNNNVGYLKGGLSGSYYPSVGVFEQTGNIDRVEMSANTGITAANFYNSIYWGSGGEGALSGASLSGYDYGLKSMTLVDPQTSIAQNWGLYYQEFQGQSASPAPDWTATAGGNDSIGVINPYVDNDGSYYYANDGGSYNYTYYSNNNYGVQDYFRPSLGAGTSTVYYSDGSTWINNYVWGDPYGYGYSYWNYTGTVAGAPWDPATTSLSSLATPPDSANATLSYTSSNVGGTNDMAYWLMDVNGQSWANGKLSATATGRYLSQTAIGTLTNDLAGVYDPVSGAWSANGVGIYEESAPLAFSGIIDYASDWPVGPYYGLMGDDGTYGYLDDSVGDAYGYIGGTAAPWSGTAVQVAYMGSYNTYDGPYIWNDDIHSYNVKDETNTTFDGGAFHGFIGGVWNNNSINARAISLYIDPDGNAGYLRGSLAGAYYPGITMFEADGTWTATQKTVAPLDIPQADFYAYGGSAYVTTSDVMWASVSGAFNGGNGSINGGSIYGWTRYINGEAWGIYDLIITGYAGGPGYGYSNPDADTVWSAKIGGGASFGNYYICTEGCWWENDNGYYLADITAGTWANGELTGAMNGKFLSQTRKGTITGDVLGYYGIDSTGSDSWAATSLGVWEGELLAHSGVVNADSNSVSFYAYDSWGWLDAAGGATGLMGGVTAPWSGTTDVTYMGSYSESGGWAAPYIWTPDINSYDVNNRWSNTTFDNGMYKGFIGGIWKGDGTIDAKVYSLYIDPVGNAGILKGGLTGAYYPTTNMFEATGQWTPTVLASEVSVWAFIDVVTSDYGYNISSSGSFNGNDTITVAGSEMGFATDWRYSIAGQDWGISKSIIGGDYTGAPTDTWSLSTDVDQWQQTFTGTQTDGTKWSADVNGNNVLAGKTYGYGADITAVPKTWISVGETFGTFDAAALTWQAAQSSAFIGTSKYLAMMQTTEGQAALGQLNIPFVEVGTANLSGSDVMGNGSVTVNMNNVAFLAYSSGAAPKIWAAGDVNGAFTCDVCGGASVALSGNGLNTNFNITTFDTVTNMNWMATVTGGGTYSGTGTLDGSAVQMTGAAAGTIDTGLSTFTGTAAGTAQ